jgi:hypothetical protein
MIAISILPPPDGAWLWAPGTLMVLGSDVRDDGTIAASWAVLAHTDDLEAAKAEVRDRLQARGSVQ